MFAAGRRPDAAALSALADRPEDRAIRFAISHAAPGGDWAELLIAGLTFDCHGLAPGPAAALPPATSPIGLASLPAGEAIVLAPGPHLAGARPSLPVVRGLVALGVQLCALPGVAAVCWHPAESWIEPGYFVRTAQAWLDGGAFPAPGLIALRRGEGGGMGTHGLGFFTGQELQFGPGEPADPAALARLAVRLVNQLVLAGPVLGPLVLTGPDGAPVHLLPAANRAVVTVRTPA